MTPYQAIEEALAALVVVHHLVMDNYGRHMVGDCPRSDAGADAYNLLARSALIVDKDEYNELVADSHLLNCLRNAGVDNWDGWDFAMEAYHEECGDEHGDD